MRETIEKHRKKRGLPPHPTAPPGKAWVDTTHPHGCMCGACRNRRLYYGGGR